ncbi:hypothetical protein BC827DRAFT_1386711 [Russula dissimulans]|nr:hypothetical protein BC827DRAFT_1386711 [Russula dissimulans]
MDFSSDDLEMGNYPVHLREGSGLAPDRRLVTIDKLPDDVLGEIFFQVNIRDLNSDIRNQWHTLVHVCRRWRYLIFASPRHLDLRLEYYGRRPMSEVLDAWPALPISLVPSFGRSIKWSGNMVTALESEHSNRICEIDIGVADSDWERFTEAMQKPFPELTLLYVWTTHVVPVLPESFLGGSAPRLRSLVLDKIPFPSIPKLVLSANGLVRLSLWYIPDSGYFSPDALATSLTVMTRLEFLRLGFHSPRSRPDPESRSLPPPTRFVLPALTQLEFKGVYEYLEDLLARIDAPLLDDLSVEFFMDLEFDVPQLHRLIGHAEEFKTYDRANVTISNYSIRLYLHLNIHHTRLEVKIHCQELDYQLSSLAQVCSSSFPFIFALEELQITENDYLASSNWKDDIENDQWLELLCPFTALKNLYLTDGIARLFCGALQELPGDRATEVLPALRNIFILGFSSLEAVQEAMEQFVAARQLSGHTVVVDHWEV